MRTRGLHRSRPRHHPQRRAGGSSDQADMAARTTLYVAGRRPGGNSGLDGVHSRAFAHGHLLWSRRSRWPNGVARSFALKRRAAPGLPRRAGPVDGTSGARNGQSPEAPPTDPSLLDRRCERALTGRFQRDPPCRPASMPVPAEPPSPAFLLGTCLPVASTPIYLLGAGRVRLCRRSPPPGARHRNTDGLEIRARRGGSQRLGDTRGAVGRCTGRSVPARLATRGVNGRGLAAGTARGDRLLSVTLFATTTPPASPVHALLAAVGSTWRRFRCT